VIVTAAVPGVTFYWPTFVIVPATPRPALLENVSPASTSPAVAVPALQVARLPEQVVKSFCAVERSLVHVASPSLHGVKLASHVARSLSQVARSAVHVRTSGGSAPPPTATATLC
jgi:hypothetical protein